MTSLLFFFHLIFKASRSVGTVFCWSLVRLWPLGCMMVVHVISILIKGVFVCLFRFHHWNCMLQQIDCFNFIFQFWQGQCHFHALQHAFCSVCCQHLFSEFFFEFEVLVRTSWQMSMSKGLLICCTQWFFKMIDLIVAIVTHVASVTSKQALAMLLVALASRFSFVNWAITSFPKQKLANLINLWFNSLTCSSSSFQCGFDLSLDAVHSVGDCLSAISHSVVEQCHWHRLFGNKKIEHCVTLPFFFFLRVPLWFCCLCC